MGSRFEMTTTLFDPRQLRRAFSRAAPRYAESAVLQREVEDRLLERLDFVEQAPARILDLGCGPGRAAAVLKKRWPRAQVIAIDLALPMLREVDRRSRWWRPLQPVCAQAQQLPLASNSVDLVFSNLCLQWVEDLNGCFGELRRVLRPRGLIALSTFSDDTLFELRNAFAEADQGAAHVSPFVALQRFGDGLLAAGFRDPVLDHDRFTLKYSALRPLMQDLRAIGAANALSSRRRSLTGKNRLRRAEAAYERYRCNEQLPATYEVTYAHAFGPEPGQPRRQGGADIAQFPVAQLRVRRREAES